MPDGTSVALQKALVTRLRGDAGVLAIVPAADIMDRSTRPERDLCVLVGEDHMVRDDLLLSDNVSKMYLTLHLWHRAQDFATVKNLSDAIRKAMRMRLVVPGINVVYAAFVDARYLRDPGGEYVHGVVTFSAMIIEPDMAFQ